tara:strand:- start:209 stop:775 length:567 start_codon:yes stop_codon:yes gene_type:complete
MTVDARNHASFSASNMFIRTAWKITELTLFRWSPRPCHRWRRFLISLFGAKIHPKARIYPSAKIWLPSNLTMEAYSCIGDNVDIYNVANVIIKNHATISQRTWICTASHDIDNPLHPLITGPIVIGPHAWIAGEAFIGPNITVGEGCVIGTRAALFNDAEEWHVFGGVPAKAIRKRGFDNTSQIEDNT